MFRLNLRKKLIIGFTAFLLFSSCINIIFLRDFDHFRKNVRMLIHASNISNLCLEVRRYEKNYIIKKEIEDYNTASDFIKKIFDYFLEIEIEVDKESQEMLSELKNELDQYMVYFIPLKDKCAGKLNLQECGDIEEIHKLGSNIVTLAESMVRDAELEIEEFTRISKIKLVLYYTFLVAFSLGGMIVFLVTIGRRLKSLEAAADAIVRGDYESLPESKLNDEVQIVFKAFDRMVTDLEERQEQLFQAEKLSSIGTLASGMAHQLNNPLNNIATSCQLAMEEVEDDKDKSFLYKLLKTIDDETGRTAEIVRGLLEFSRSELFACKLVSLKEVINKVVGLVSSELPSGITIIQDIPRELVACIDEQKITEVFLNLIINSIQAIKELTGSIVIAAEVDLDTNWIVISVSDTGTGIEEAMRQQIFDPFYTTKKVGTGTGLGLAVVYGIIKKHKGTISVRNNKEKGATFVVSLPPS